MNGTRPMVHPIEAPPSQTDGGAADVIPRRRMDNIPGMAGTRGGLALRLLQFALTLISFCVLITASPKHRLFTVFWCLATAILFQCGWSFCVGMVDLYAILVKRSLRNSKLVIFLTIGDWIFWTLTFCGACAGAGALVRMSFDVHACKHGDCWHQQASTVMAFLCWFLTAPSYFLNFWTLASKAHHH